MANIFNKYRNIDIWRSFVFQGEKKNPNFVLWLTSWETLVYCVQSLNFLGLQLLLIFPHTPKGLPKNLGQPA